MSEEPSQEVIIVRRRVESEDGHHGGAWKIAYADFVTAMMAFFLVLWILNSTNRDSQTIIARYFNPVRMEDFAKAKKGIRERAGRRGQARFDRRRARQDSARGPGAGQGGNAGQGAEQGSRRQNADERRDPVPRIPMRRSIRSPARRREPREGITGSPVGDQGAIDGFNDPFRSAGAEAEAEDASAAEQAEASPAPTPPVANATPAASRRPPPAPEAARRRFPKRKRSKPKRPKPRPPKPRPPRRPRVRRCR